MPKPKWNLNTVYISERLQESLRPISRCAMTTVVAPIELGDVLDIAMLKPVLEAHDANGNTITQGIQIVPASINLYVVVEKTQLNKKVNVVPQFTGVITPGYIAGETVIDPAQVNILGDQAKAESLSEVVTKPIDLSGRIDSFTQTVDLVLEAEYDSIGELSAKEQSNLLYLYKKYTRLLAFHMGKLTEALEEEKEKKKHED